MSKQGLRRLQLARRRALDPQLRTQWSLWAQQQLVQLSWFYRARTVALYSPIHGEVDTALLFSSALAAGKRVVFPRIDNQQMVFVAVEGRQDLEPGAFAALEPCGQAIVAVDDLDLVIVPGVAFDRYGFRLGYGKGYYDQAFEMCSFRCVLLGLGYSFQLEDRLPHEPHDVGLTGLVTEKEVHLFVGDFD